jgi:hypothetical protein
MALVLNDRVKETSVTTGTGTLDLDGAVTGFETFVAGIATTNTTYYCIDHTGSYDEWEVGLGTVTDASPDTLSRDTVISSSNSDGKVDFTAGTLDVFCTFPASKTMDMTLTSIELIQGGAKIVAKNGDVFKALSSTASSLDVVLSYVDTISS